MIHDQRDPHQKRAPRLDKKGMAAIEFGLFIPLFATALLCCAELGFFIEQTMQVNTAIQAGVTVAAQQGFEVAAIQNAISTNTGVAGHPGDAGADPVLRLREQGHGGAERVRHDVSGQSRAGPLRQNQRHD